MNTFAASADGCRICLLEFAIVLKLKENKTENSSGEMQRLQMNPPLPNFIPRGSPALPDFPGLFKKSSFKMEDRPRIVGVKTRTKAFFFEQILINFPLKNLYKLSKERMQYFCHALKLNLRSRHSARASNCSMNRSLELNMIINFLQQRILCLILPAVKSRGSLQERTQM